LCIKESEVKKLKLLVGGRRDKGRGLAPREKIQPSRVTPLPVTEENEKPVPLYEPTNMSVAYNSEYWRWRRVLQWFRDYKDLYTMTD
jgi:hypothetical protein